MIRTRLCDLLGIQYPILEAPMGEKMGAKLTAAVSNAGGIGCIRQSPIFFGRDPRDVMREDLQEVKRLTNKPIMVNVKFSEEDKGFYEVREAFLEAVLEEKSRDPQLDKMIVAIYTSAGNALPFGKRIKQAGLKWIHKVGRLKHAMRAEETGADALVAMSNAAGGNLGDTLIDSNVLLPLFADSVKIPVIGSGGFVDGKSLAAALLLGAEGVEMGTRLMATQEADFHPNVKTAIVEAEAEDTVVAPGRFSSARAYRNKFMVDRLRKSGGLTEEQMKTTNPKLKAELLKEWEAALRLQVEKGDIENGVLLMGQGAGRIADVPTVHELLQRIMNDAESAVRKLAGGL
ncbi:MAG: nitronate monooxygenase [Chloroflexi bacterium]|nr:nitronate monooxygenase [Chloroflexota bacterium]